MKKLIMPSLSKGGYAYHKTKSSGPKFSARLMIHRTMLTLEAPRCIKI